MLEFVGVTRRCIPGVAAFLLSLPLLPVPAAIAAPQLSLNVIASTGGRSAPHPIDDGSTLRSGDRIQFLVRSSSDTYVYVVLYGSSHRARLMRPAAAAGADLRLSAGHAVAIPGPGRFLQLDDVTGAESVFALAADAPVHDIDALLARMDAAGPDLQRVTAAVRDFKLAFVRMTFEHAGLGASVPAPAAEPAGAAAGEVAGTAEVAAAEPPAQAGDGGRVLSAEGSKIRQIMGLRFVDRGSSGRSAGPASGSAGAPSAAGAEPSAGGGGTVPESGGETAPPGAAAGPGDTAAAAGTASAAEVQPQPQALGVERETAAAEENSGGGLFGALKRFLVGGEPSSAEAGVGARTKSRAEPAPPGGTGVEFTRAFPLPASAAGSHAQAAPAAAAGASAAPSGTQAPAAPVTPEPEGPAGAAPPVAPPPAASAPASAVVASAPASPPPSAAGSAAGSVPEARAEGAAPAQEGSSVAETLAALFTTGNSGTGEGTAAAAGGSPETAQDQPASASAGEGAVAPAEPATTGPAPPPAPGGGTASGEGVDIAPGSPSTASESAQVEDTAPATASGGATGMGSTALAAASSIAGAAAVGTESSAPEAFAPASAPSASEAPAQATPQAPPAGEAVMLAAASPNSDSDSSGGAAAGVPAPAAGEPESTAAAAAGTSSASREAGGNRPAPDAGESGGGHTVLGTIGAMFGFGGSPGAGAKAAAAGGGETTAQESGERVAAAAGEASGGSGGAPAPTQAGADAASGPAGGGTGAGGGPAAIQGGEGGEPADLSGTPAEAPAREQTGGGGLLGSIGQFFGIGSSGAEPAPRGATGDAPRSAEGAGPKQRAPAGPAASGVPGVAAQASGSSAQTGASSARPAPTRTGRVLSGEGRKIEALLVGETAPQSTSGVRAAGPPPPAPPSASASAPSVPAPAAVPSVSPAPDAVPAAAGGEPPSAPSPAAGSSTLLALGAAPRPASPPASGGEPAREASLSAAAPFSPVDVAADGVASSVVLVVTPSGAGSGVVVDAAGHVLTNWHLVRDYPAVSVLFKSAASARPALERSYVARVVKLNRSADLALLSIEDPPAALRPMPIAKGGDPRRSEVLHALGHQRSDAWSDLRGVVLQSRPDSSWFSGGSVLHRGDVIRVRVEQSAVIPGVPLLDGRMELVGLGAYVDLPKHELVAVSARTIRAFLESAEARTAAATGG